MVDAVEQRFDCIGQRRGINSSSTNRLGEFYEFDLVDGIFMPSSRPSLSAVPETAFQNRRISRNARTSRP